MADKNPKMEFQTNIPAQVKLIKMFKKGEGTYGPWYAWEVENEGEKKTLFADEEMQKEFDACGGTGATVTVIKEEKKSEKGKTYHTFKIVPTLFDKDGRAPEPAKPKIDRDPIAYEQYREERVRKLAEAIEDAREAMMLASEKYGSAGFTTEDIRAMAISLMISFDRKTQ